MPSVGPRLFALLLCAATLPAQTPPAPPKPAPPQNAPSPAPPTRADILRGAYGPFRGNNDLLYYHLDLRVDPVAKTIAGTNSVRFRMLADATRIQLDLTPTLTIDRILLAGAPTPLHYTRDDAAVFIDFPSTLRRGQTYTVAVTYSGAPKSSGRFGGMSYETDPAGRPWIFTADEDDGCSIFWPCKDQWKDEPQDGMDISVAVPTGLTDVSNGRLVSTVPLTGEQAGYTQWNWHVSYPINSYDVALNIGAYTYFADTYTNPAFPPLTLDFYCLPEDLAKAKSQFAQVKGMLDAFEHYFGEYPFARDGYKLVEVPYAGMEHQSAVAYGNRFTNGYLGRDWTGVGISPNFDFIIIHESGHEWFGNAVTAADRSDMWIHEGWDTYLEALFVEFHYGREAALRYINGIPEPAAEGQPGYIPPGFNGLRGHVSRANRRPILTERGVNGDPPQDQYFKGAMMINTLRSVLATTGSGNSNSAAAADAHWFALIRAFYQHFKYQNILTEDVVAWWNAQTRQDLTPFFNQYLRHVDIPTLELNFDPGTHTVLYKWRADEPTFGMPVLAGDPAHWQILHPTTTWQTLPTSLTPDQFQVATDLFYIDVSKT